jgi:hypothetical protein
MDESFSFEANSARRKKGQSRVLLGVAMVAFLLGAALTWFLAAGQEFSPGDLLQVRNTEAEQAEVPESADATPAAPPSPTATAEAEAAEEARQAAERVEQVVEQAGGLDQRVAAMEQRITRLALRAEAAAGNAARAEGLLIVFATRRAIERGAPLDYLEDQLRLRFGDARPNAVQTVIDAAKDPVTLDQLIARFDGLAPVLREAPEEEGPLDWLSREMSELFVVRTEDTPSPLAERRLERARLFLETGRIEAAVSEVRNLPNAGEAADWIEDAESYAAAQRALETLETTAILEPRELRDGVGNRVEQPSPASIAPPGTASR